MADLPPAYTDTNYDDVPNYSDAARRPNQWRVVMSLNQKKRFTTFVPISETALANKENSESSGLLSYKIGAIHPIELQVRGFPSGDPRGNCFEGPSDPASSQQLLVANIQLSTNHPALGDVAFVESGRDQNIFIDAKDISTSMASNDPMQELTVFLTYHEASEKVPLPIGWRVEPKTVHIEQSSSEVNNNPIHEEKKKSFWHKDHSKRREKEAKSDPALERQKSFLNSTLRLCDDDGKVYANFESDFYSHTPSLLHKDFEKVGATHRSWGTITIIDPGFDLLRSQNSFFEKWSILKLEQLVLISLGAILETNLRLQGGSEGKAFTEALTRSAAMGSILGAEGLLGISDKALSGLSRSMQTNWFSS